MSTLDGTRAIGTSALLGDWDGNRTDTLGIIRPDCTGCVVARSLHRSGP